MTIAETAKLAVQLNLEGNFNSGIATAESRLGTFGTAVGSGTTKAETFASRLSGGVGSALSTFKGRLEGAARGIAVFTGIGGLLSLGGALEHGISMAQSFGDEVRQLSAITGLGAEAASSMAAALEHFGIGADKATRLVGFMEKNVGLLAARKDGIAKFQKEFGLTLTDNNGKLLDANALLLQTADYFNNKSIPATEKAAALSKIYGRSWQDLIPILKAGRQGIADAEVEAKTLGLTLTGDNVKALGDLKNATRDWNTALGGLELQIGLTLVPTITDLAKHLTSFVRDHRTDIVQFFKDAAKFAGDAAGTIGNVVGSISGFWNGLPKPFRDLLVSGLVADKTVKFLFGFDPIKLGGSLLGKGFDLFASRGSSPANPMFVSGGGGGGGPGGGLSPIWLAGVIASAAALVGTLDVVQNNIVLPDIQKQQNQNNAGVQGVIATGDAGKIGQALAGIQAGIDSLNPFQRALYELNADGSKTATESLIAALKGAFDKAQKDSERNLQPLPAKISKAQEHNFNVLRDRIEANRIASVTAGSKTATAIDHEKSAITRAIAAQKLAVTVIAKTSVSINTYANAVRTFSMYSTGMKGALIGSGIG